MCLAQCVVVTNKTIGFNGLSDLPQCCQQFFQHKLGITLRHVVQGLSIFVPFCLFGGIPWHVCLKHQKQRAHRPVLHLCPKVSLAQGLTPFVRYFSTSSFT